MPWVLVTDEGAVAVGGVAVTAAAVAEAVEADGPPTPKKLLRPQPFLGRLAAAVSKLPAPALSGLLMGGGRGRVVDIIGEPRRSRTSPPTRLIGGGCSVSGLTFEDGFEE